MANRNMEFYFQDIVFRVENQLFKVPRHMFVQHSQVFRDMFQIPIPEDTEPDGSSDERPLTLEGIEKEDFIQLLRCLYPPQFQRVIGHDFSLDEWTSVLKLTNIYEMTEVKDFAVDCMTPLLEMGSPSLQIHLAQVCNVPKWLQPAKAKLIDRSSPINEYDVMLIGLPLALEVCALRENAVWEKALRESALRENAAREKALRENASKIAMSFLFSSPELNGSGRSSGDKCKPLTGVKKKSSSSKKTCSLEYDGMDPTNRIANLKMGV